MRKRLGIVLTAFAPLVASGCSEYFELHVRGSLEEGVFFVVTNAEGDAMHVPLREFQVASAEGAILWHIAGTASTGRVAYGELPRGFTTETEATPLRVGGTYLASGNSRGRLSPPAGASVEFTIEEDGSTREVERYAGATSPPPAS